MYYSFSVGLFWKYFRTLRKGNHSRLLLSPFVSDFFAASIQANMTDVHESVPGGLNAVLVLV